MLNVLVFCSFRFDAGSFHPTLQDPLAFLANRLTREFSDMVQSRASSTLDPLVDKLKNELKDLREVAPLRPCFKSAVSHHVRVDRMYIQPPEFGFPDYGAPPILTGAFETQHQ